MRDEETENKYYSNKDMVRMFHPNNVALPHIYDSLEYNHCVESDPTDDEFHAVDFDEEMHFEFRGRLMSSLRSKMAQNYATKLAGGYTEDEAKKLTAVYESLFEDSTLENYHLRPVYTTK